jgi:hypothetical protein
MPLGTTGLRQYHTALLTTTDEGFKDWVITIDFENSCIRLN